MKISVMQRLLLIPIVVTSIILVWYFYKLFSAGFLNAKSSLSPGISANVGEFIGGTIGLIISITTLIILFQTFYSQNRQFKDVQFSNSIELLLTMHESIVKDIEKLKFEKYKGELSILHFTNPSTPNVFLDKLNFIINSYKLLIGRCKNIVEIQKDSQMIDIAKDLLSKFYLSFYTKIIWVIIALDEKDQSKPQPYNIYLPLAMGAHDDARYFLSTFGILAKESFKFLMENKLIPDNDWKKISLERIEAFIS